MCGLHISKGPVFTVFEERCRENIRRMAAKAASQGVIFRPHFKTHASVTIGEYYRQEGITRITVSSVSMAEYFAAAGWNDITIAFPFYAGIAERINALAEKIRLNIIVSTAGAAEQAAGLLRCPINAFIETDTGYPRSGIKADDYETIRLAYSWLKKNPRIEFRGFLAHFGHSYAAKSKEQVSEIWHTGIALLKKLKQQYPGNMISAGDTTCCSMVADLSGADEIRPGNFVFYDLMQVQIESCKPENVAVAVYCPVVAIYPHEEKIVLHAGAVHLSKDTAEINGKRVYGQLGIVNKDGFPDYLDNCYISSLSQEHAVVHVPPKHMPLFREGMTVAIMPVHSCLTADAMGGGFVLPSMAALGMMR
jgi:D-serine deaminase-like pyridoxal phosphate-dependent protein